MENYGRESCNVDTEIGGHPTVDWETVSPQLSSMTAELEGIKKLPRKLHKLLIRGDTEEMRIICVK